MAKLKVIALHPKAWSKCKLDEIEVKHISIGGSIPKRLDGTPSWDGIGEVASSKGIYDLVELNKRYQPDIVLFGIHFELNRSIFERIREDNKQVKFVMHYTDQRKDVPDEVLKYRKIIDLLLVTNKDCEDHQKYLDAGIPIVRTFYDGFDPKEYKPILVNDRFDVFFGGNDHYGLYMKLKRTGINPPEALMFPLGGFRHEFVRKVDQNFNLCVRGSFGWDGLKNVKPMVFHPRYNQALNTGKIVLATSVYPKYGLCMRRMIRSLASGRMFMINYIPGMEEMFVNHKHLVWFYNQEDGIEKIRYYLQYNIEREKISKSGCEFVNRWHTFDHRLSEFNGIVREVF